jgi:hypothetical protein
MSPTKFRTNTNKRQLCISIHLSNNNNNKNSVPNIDKGRPIKQHDRVCGQLHFTIFKKMGGKRENKDWY